MFKYFSSGKKKTERLIKRSKENAEKLIKKHTGCSVSKNGHLSGSKKKNAINQGKGKKAA